MLHYRATGSIAFNRLGLGTTAEALILLALGVKCAFPLLHNWLEDAYPEATVTGTVFLSSFTTKVAIYALARGYAGTEILIPIGAVMTAFPIFYAVIENDLRRVLSYSMNNQLGFMVVGIGIGTDLALNGAVAHAFADILFKGLLFMSMGAVLFRVGTIKGSELGGLYKSMPWTAGFCMVGAASISAMPLFSAFVTKSMIMSEAMDKGYFWVWLTLLFASAGVVEHAGIKIPYFAFFAHDSGKRCKEAPANMLTAMAISAALCIAIGSLPSVFYTLLPYNAAYQPYTLEHVVTQIQLLLFAAARRRGPDPDRHLSARAALHQPRLRLGLSAARTRGGGRVLRAERQGLGSGRGGCGGRRRLHQPAAPSPPRPRRGAGPQLAHRHHGAVGDPHAGRLPRPLLCRRPMTSPSRDLQRYRGPSFTPTICS